MNKKAEDLLFPDSTNVDLTIYRCKKKLAGLRRHIKSVNYQRIQNSAYYFKDRNDSSIKNNLKQIQLSQSEKYKDTVNKIDERIFKFENGHQVEKKRNFEMNECLEIDSESSLSYNHSFVNNLIDRYYSTFNSKLPEINKFDKNCTFDTSNNLFTPKLVKNDERKDFKVDQNISNKNGEELNGIKPTENTNNGTELFRDLKVNDGKESLEKQVSLRKTLLKQYDSETKEVVDNLNKKIRQLERKLKKENKRKLIQNKHDFQKLANYEHLEKFNKIESKLLSISVIPPYGISCFESSFLPYYCTVQEIQILKDLISVKGQIFNSLKTSIEAINIGKMFCCHARVRFIDSIRKLYQDSLIAIKLKLLIHIEEPEILLAKTFGPEPIESEENIHLYELEAIYEMEKVSRFLICLLITDRPMECYAKKRYTINNTNQVLPIYIININSISN